MKSHPDFIPSQKHILLTQTNEMFFLALPFIDEKFYILNPNHMIYDVDHLRNLILYHMAIDDLFPGLSEDNNIDTISLEKRTENYQNIVSKMNNELKQQIINDVVALSIIVSSENFPPFPEIKKLGTNAHTYAKLLESYRELNQPYIHDQISQNQDDKIEFTPLIINNVFRKIMTKFIDAYCNNGKHPGEDENNTKEDDLGHFQEESQQLFMVFNFTWQLYTNRCLSWSFLYQFKKSPPLKIALKLMHEEGLDVFDTEGSNDMTEPLFKNFIIYPVEAVNIPYPLYKLKIPPSPISRFWPLGVTKPADIPIIDVNEVKLLYKKKILLKKHMKLQEKEMNGGKQEENPFEKTYEVARKQNGQQMKRRGKNGSHKRSMFPVGRRGKY